jgi:DNA-binding response OmpR family regulator
MTLPENDILEASILIVDDQDSNIGLLKQILSEGCYSRVSSTSNGQEVCELHRKNGYDLILLDLVMPTMDGFQVMADLKTNTADAYLPVLVLTAHPDHKLRALQAGAKDFISKPFDIIEVTTRIRNMLEVRLLYKKLENYNAMPEQTVQERTAQLRERVALIAREQAARLEAESANRAKDVFLAMLGHELRNPLSAVTSAIEVLNRVGSQAEIEINARRILRRQTQHLSHMLDDLLDVARVTSGHLALARRDMDLAARVQHIVGTLEITGQPNAHQLTLDLQEVWVNADPTRIEQVKWPSISWADRFR